MDANDHLGSGMATASNRSSASGLPRFQASPGDLVLRAVGIRDGSITPVEPRESICPAASGRRLDYGQLPRGHHDGGLS